MCESYCHQARTRVLVIDDLVATGGTLIAACDLLATVKATIVECACIVELKMLGGYAKLQAKHWRKGGGPDI